MVNTNWNETDKKILFFLRTAREPQDTENIRIKCGIGNWSTALTHLLELLVQGKIHGQKSSKSWTFWMPNRNPTIAFDRNEIERTEKRRE